MTTTFPKVQIDRKTYVIVPKKEFDQLVKRSRAAPSQDDLPPLPKADAKGNMPALEYMRVSIARTLIQDRKAAGLTQQALADQAGVRQETIARIESGKHNVSEATVKKIDKVLTKFK